MDAAPRSHTPDGSAPTSLQLARDAEHPNREANFELLQGGVAYYQIHALLDADYREGERRRRVAATSATADTAGRER